MVCVLKPTCFVVSKSGYQNRSEEGFAKRWGLTCSKYVQYIYIQYRTYNYLEYIILYAHLQICKYLESQVPYF